MEFLRRLFTGKPAAPALEAFTIPFPNNHSPLAVRVSAQGDAEAVIRALRLPQPVPVIFISGGAGKMDSESMMVTRSTVEDGLARFLNDHQVALIDGGTATGVMMLIGVARQRRSYTFPLIGVAPDSVVTYPGIDPPREGETLDSFHSHFVFTGGDQFGAESEMIVKLAYALSGQGEKKRLCMIINGGEIVKQEAYRCSTHEPRFPLLVLEGSGRFADELANSRKTGSSDPVIQAILEQGIVHFIPIKGGADNLRMWLENFFGY